MSARASVRKGGMMADRPLGETQRMVRRGWVAQFVDEGWAESVFDEWLDRHDRQIRADALHAQAERFRQVPDAVGRLQLPSWSVADIIDARAARVRDGLD